jgi:arginine exporter protein ArgO
MGIVYLLGRTFKIGTILVYFTFFRSRAISHDSRRGHFTMIRVVMIVGTVIAVMMVVVISPPCMVVLLVFTGMAM